MKITRKYLDIFLVEGRGHSTSVFSLFSQSKVVISSTRLQHVEVKTFKVVKVSDHFLFKIIPSFYSFEIYIILSLTIYGKGISKNCFSELYQIVRRNICICSNINLVVHLGKSMA